MSMNMISWKLPSVRRHYKYTVVSHWLIPWLYDLEHSTSIQSRTSAYFYLGELECFWPDINECHIALVGSGEVELVMTEGRPGRLAENKLSRGGDETVTWCRGSALTGNGGAVDVERPTTAWKWTSKLWEIRSRYNSDVKAVIKINSVAW